MAHSPTDFDPIAITLKVTGVLDALHVPYFIGGSLASTVHGMVRTTQDSDIIAKLEQQHAQVFTTALQEEFFVDEQMLAGAISRRGSFNILHKESLFKIDIFIPSERNFTKQQFARSKPVALSEEPQTQAVVASAEDTILAKLEWYSQGGQASERQWRDILGLLQVQAGALDMGYLQRMAQELSLASLLTEALNAG